MRLTSVASAVALLSTQPVWAALLARSTGNPVGFSAWLGIVVAFVGILILTGVDTSTGSTALLGDGLALLGAMFAAAYVALGERARQNISTSNYSMTTYGIATRILLPVALFAGAESVSSHERTVREDLRLRQATSRSTDLAQTRTSFAMNPAQTPRASATRI